MKFSFLHPLWFFLDIICSPDIRRSVALKAYRRKSMLPDIAGIALAPHLRVKFATLKV